MLFKQSILNGIAEGRVTLAFRRWRRPTVKAGGTLKTAIGVLHIRTVDIIDESQITLRAARQAGFDSVDELIKSLGERNGNFYRIKFKRTGDDPRIALRESDQFSDDEINEIQLRLDRLDAHSKVGAWTIPVMRLIARFPELRAVELARRSGYEKEWLKVNIRKLKNLGLTESLDVGYRLSPRGRSFLKAARNV